MNKKAIVTGALVFFSVPMIVGAAVLWSGNHHVIAQGEKRVGNAYVIAEQSFVAGVLDGDLSAAAKQILVTGEIKEDLLAAGNQIQISGAVGGDVRVIGQELTLAGDVKGDFAGLGEKFYVASGSVIGGDVIFAGGMAEILGAVSGRIRASAGDVLINGPVKGGLDIEGSSLTLGPSARVDGAVLFRGPKAPMIAPGATITGGTTYVKTDFGAHRFGGFARGFSAGAAIMLLAMCVVVSVLLFLLFRRSTLLLTHAGVHYFWVSAGRGVTAFLLVLVLSGLACASVIGLPAGIFGFLLLGATSILASALSGIIFASWFKRVILQRQNYEPTLSGVIWGAIVVRLIALIPIFGGLISIVFFLVAFGVLAHAAHERFWARR